ncbi:hypothetical protein Plim_3369 [Planctopirus limnophila DSM 3776]|uniref:Uncharacterized protein n=1 Tax=Planctopirus limnophila (strain ATCC 43296 / DSM 3776 / IFAM 1008 / Mu 290) TaxID=521674 RepID=D5SUC9_PLAL2|nr:hypothetical protein Plim_3369 [Planctopirus limnophila DSM 3776]
MVLIFQGLQSRANQDKVDSGGRASAMRVLLLCDNTALDDWRQSHHPAVTKSPEAMDCLSSLVEVYGASMG